MAIFRLELKSISRRNGRSAVAAAAYRSGENLHDPVSGKDFDYSPRQRTHAIEHSEIIAPQPALADALTQQPGIGNVPSGHGPPAWATDRQQLWAHVEQFEKRRDAALAREIVLALPHEMTKEQRIEAVRDFVKKHIVDKGMIADIALHKADDGKKNWHAHIMMTTRPLVGQEFGDAPKLERGRHAWGGKQQLHEWRQEWANTLNRHLEKANIPERVDHRSHRERGTGLKPIHIKQNALLLEQAGIRTVEGDAAREAALHNKLVEIAPLAVAGIQQLDAAIDRMTSPIARDHAVERLERFMEDLATRAPELSLDGLGTGAAREVAEASGKAVSAAGKIADAALKVAAAPLAFLFDIGGPAKQEPRESIDDRIARLDSLAQQLRNDLQDFERQRAHAIARHFEDDRSSGRERERD